MVLRHIYRGQFQPWKWAKIARKKEKIVSIYFCSITIVSYWRLVEEKSKWCVRLLNVNTAQRQVLNKCVSKSASPLTIQMLDGNFCGTNFLTVINSCLWILINYTCLLPAGSCWHSYTKSQFFYLLCCRMKYMRRLALFRYCDTIPSFAIN